MRDFAIMMVILLATFTTGWWHGHTNANDRYVAQAAAAQERVAVVGQQKAELEQQLVEANSAWTYVDDLLAELDALARRMDGMVRMSYSHAFDVDGYRVTVHRYRAYEMPPGVTYSVDADMMTGEVTVSVAQEHIMEIMAELALETVR